MFKAIPLLLATMAAPLAAQAPAAPVPPAKPAQPAIPFVKAEADAAIVALATALEQNFVFPDKGRAYAAMLRAKRKAGAYADFPSAQAFSKAVTADLQAVHPDGHLKMGPLSPQMRAKLLAGPGGGPKPEGKSSIVHSGWLADRVAYIRFDGFPGNAPTLAALRTFLAAHKDATSLIIDARNHHGGGLAEMDLLFPALFARPTVLVTMDTRKAVADRGGGFTEGEASIRPVSGPDGVKRVEHVVAPATAPGALRDARVYLLISPRTVSAGEHLSLALKRTKRATLIGETTRGAGHYGEVMPIGPVYGAFIPVGRTFDPDTGEGWEGVGVKPDVAVAADQALDEALRRAGVSASGAQALARLN